MNYFFSKQRYKKNSKHNEIIIFSTPSNSDNDKIGIYYKTNKVSHVKLAASLGLKVEEIELCHL